MKQPEIMVCKIGDYNPPRHRKYATVIYDDKKVAECYTNEDAILIGHALKAYNEANREKQPVRSVSDEDVEGAKVAALRITHGKDPWFPCTDRRMRAALEHFAAIAQTVGKYQSLCAAMYQAAGAYGMPVRFLDALSDASVGEIESRQKTATLLPCENPAQAVPNSLTVWANAEASNGNTMYETARRHVLEMLKITLDEP